MTDTPADDRRYERLAASAADLVPRPDPTKLTTEAVATATTQYRRELFALRELVETRMDGADADRQHLWDAVNGWPDSLAKLLEQRRREFLEDMQAGQVLVFQRIDTLMSAYQDAKTAEREFVLSQIQNVADVMDQRFSAVDGKFSESKVAVDAAFAAAKEAVAEQNKGNDRAITKSETAVKEQLAALSTVTDAGLKGLEDKIGDVRERLTALENRTAGLKEGGGEQRSTALETLRNAQAAANQRILVYGLVISVVLIVVNVVIALTLHK